MALNPSDIQMTARSRNALSKAAIKWYAQHQRVLPFRQTTDPYKILVSEVMLQQTVVSAAIGHYERFIEAFPDVASLAAADIQEVLTLWAGLGYYRRARLLHQAARDIVTEHDGKFPESLTEIMRLPGVGRYSAGAVYSFAYDRPAPIVEANTARLYARLFGIRGVLSSPDVSKRLWLAAEQLLVSANPRLHNYALMELGALVCRAVPQCGACPVSAWCEARKQNAVHEIPAPKPQREKVERRRVGLVASYQEKFLVRRIPAGEWHEGLFEFPSGPAGSPAVGASKEAALLAKQADVRIKDPKCFAELNYVVTHHKVHLVVMRAHMAGVPARLPRDYHLLPLSEISRLPLGSAQTKLLKLLRAGDDLFAGES